MSDVLAQEVIVSRLAAASDDQRRRLTKDFLHATVPDWTKVRATDLADGFDVGAPNAAFRAADSFDGVVDTLAHQRLYLKGASRWAEGALNGRVELDVADLAMAVRLASAVQAKDALGLAGKLTRAGLIGADVAAHYPELPSSARSLVAGFVDLKSANSAALIDLCGRQLTEMLASSGKEGSELSRKALQANGAIAIPSDAAQKTLLSIQSFGSISQFLIGRVAGKPEVAQRFGVALQAGQALYQAYLLYGTGGLSALSASAGVLSIFGGAQGLGLGSADAGSAALSNQIRELRAIMIERFDRLEALQQTALARLDELRVQLEQSHVEVASKLQSLRTDVATIAAYIHVKDRQDEVNWLNSEAIDPILVTKTYVPEVDRYLKNALRYASDRSQSVAFLGTPGKIGTILDADRVDLCLSQLPEAMTLLGKGSVPILHNPVEWTRGVTTFAEACARLNAPLSLVLRQEARRNHKIGKSLVGALDAAAGEEALKALGQWSDRSPNDIFERLYRVLEKRLGVQRPQSRTYVGAAKVAQLQAPQPLPQVQLEWANGEDIFVDTHDNNNPILGDWRVSVFSKVLSTYQRLGILELRNLGQVPGMGYTYYGASGMGIQAPLSMAPRFTKYTASNIDVVRKSNKTIIAQVRRWDLDELLKSGNTPLGVKKWVMWEARQDVQALLTTIANAGDTDHVREAIGKMAAVEIPEVQEFTAAVAAACLVCSLAGWRIAGRLDQPRYAPALQGIPKTNEELCRVLSELVSKIDAELLLKDAAADEAPNSAGNLAKLRAVASERLKNGRSNSLVEWEDLDFPVDYLMVLRSSLEGWRTQLREGVTQLSKQVSPARFGLLEKAMQKLEISLS